MKALLSIALVLLLVPTIYGQADNPLRGVIAGAAWSDDHISEEMDFGVKVGTVVPIDMGKGLWLRTLYNRWNYKPTDPIQAIQISLLIEFDLSSKWTLYGIGDSQNYVGGDNAGTDFGGGVGASFCLHRYGERDWLMPGEIALFVELNYIDGGSQPTGSFIGAQLGLAISRPFGK